MKSLTKAGLVSSSTLTRKLPEINIDEIWDENSIADTGTKSSVERLPESFESMTLGVSRTRDRAQKSGQLYETCEVMTAGIFETTQSIVAELKSRNEQLTSAMKNAGRVNDSAAALPGVVSEAGISLVGKISAATSSHYASRVAQTVHATIESLTAMSLDIAQSINRESESYEDQSDQVEKDRKNRASARQNKEAAESSLIELAEHNSALYPFAQIPLRCQQGRGRPSR